MQSNQNESPNKMLLSGTHHTQLQMKLINEMESGKNVLPMIQSARGSKKEVTQFDSEDTGTPGKPPKAAKK